MEKIWEHNFVYSNLKNADVKSDFVKITTILNRLSLEGWELFSTSGNAEFICWTLRREIKPVAPYR